MNDSVQFDESVYQELRSELGDEDAIEVLKVFLADCSGKFRMLAAKCDDVETLTREAHSIKSSSATFGFTVLSGLARELETGASRLTPVQIKDSLGRMQQAFDQAVRLAETRLIGQRFAAA